MKCAFLNLSCLFHRKGSHLIGLSSEFSIRLYPIAFNKERVQILRKNAFDDQIVQS